MYKEQYAWRIWILMLECKGLKALLLKPSYFFSVEKCQLIAVHIRYAE